MFVGVFIIGMLHISVTLLYNNINIMLEWFKLMVNVTPKKVSSYDIQCHVTSMICKTYLYVTSRVTRRCT